MKKFTFEDEAEDTDILAEDDLDLVEDEDVEQVNEVRYIDPANLDKYDKDEIEEVTTASGEKRYKRKTSTQATAKKEEPAEKKDSKQAKNINITSFDEIPDRNDVNWRAVSDYARRTYDNLVVQMFSRKKLHDSHAYTMIQTILDNNLDGAVIDNFKEHIKETPEIAKALKVFDDALQEKDLDKSWKAYQNLWDAHRNATKRKYNRS